MQHSIHSKSNKWNKNVKNFSQAKILKFSKKKKYIYIYIIHTIYTYACKSFSTTLEKGLRKTIKQKKKGGNWKA